MSQIPTIRLEKPADIELIADITKQAFASHPHSNQTEHLIIDALRNGGALTISMVAEMDDKVIGHIAFSPVSISDGAVGWYGLGPMAVRPDLQGNGIGSALVECGLRLLKEHSAQGCVLVGAAAFYGRFGFRNCKELVYDGVPQEYFLALPFGESLPRGQVTYDDAFNVQY